MYHTHVEKGKCMKAAIVVEAGHTPIYGDFKEPVPADGEVQVTRQRRRAQ